MDKLSLSWKPYSLSLKYPFSISNYTRTSTPVVLIELSYGDKIGYGEASLPQYLGETQESVIEFLNKIDLSQFSNFDDIENILVYIDSLAESNTAAKASIDIALHDLIGKIENKPCYEIWGIDSDKAPNTTYTIGIDKADVVKKKTTEIIDHFKIIKVKLGGAADKETIELIRSITDLPFVIDANQGWSDKNMALDMIYWLKEKGAVLIEQPMSKYDLDGNAWLTSQGVLPIFADESVQRLADMYKIKGAFSGINIKLMKCTGLHEARKMISLAPSFGFDVMLGCMTETSCAISAAAQLSPTVSFADLDGALLITNDCFEGIQIREGKIILNDLPGIGVKKITF